MKYGVAVHESLAQVHPLKPTSRTADLRQAEYFLGLLRQGRAQVVDELARHRSALEIQRKRGDLVDFKRLRRLVRVKESELNTVDRLIEALQARFWALRPRR
jgi:hypothetical protein